MRAETPVMAEEVHGFDNKDIPTAVPVIQWDIIQQRLFWHLDIAVRVVIAADNMAQNEERRAEQADMIAYNERVKISLIQSFNWFTGIKISTATREQTADAFNEAAQDHRENAQQIRSAGIKFGVGYLLLATGLEITRWLYQQGLLHSAYHSIKNACVGIKNAFVRGLRSIFADSAPKQKATVVSPPPAATVVRPGDIDNDGNPIEPDHKENEKSRLYAPSYATELSSAPSLGQIVPPPTADQVDMFGNVIGNTMPPAIGVTDPRTGCTPL